MSDINDLGNRELGENNLTELLTSIHTEALRDAVRDRPFNAGSLQNVIAKKEYYIQAHIDKKVDGHKKVCTIQDREETKQMIKDMFVQQKIFAYDVQFPLKTLQQYADEILTYVVRRQAYKQLGKPLNNPDYVPPTNKEGEELFNNILQTYDDLKFKIDIMTREQIGNFLYNKGVYVTDSDALFLMIYEIAEEDKNILILRNPRKLYNPYISMLKRTDAIYEKQLPTLIQAYHRLCYK